MQNRKVEKKINTIATLYKQHSRWGVIDKKMICGTLVSAMGCGGGFIPMVIKCKRKQSV